MDYLYAFLLGLTFVAGIVAGILVCSVLLRRDRLNDQRWDQTLSHYKVAEGRLADSAEYHRRIAASLEKLSGPVI